MKFNNTLTIEGIISIITLFATFITIRQVQKQRLDANMPYIIMDFTEDYDQTYSIKKEEDQVCLSDKFDFKIKNIGNGIAKDIMVSIDYRRLDTVRCRNIRIFNNGAIRFRYENIKFLHKNSSNYFPYMENGSCKNIKNTILPYYYIINNHVLFHIEEEEIYRLTKDINNPSLVVKISYSDIFNKTYISIFFLSFISSLYL